MSNKRALDSLERYVKDLELLEQINRREVSDARSSTAVAMAFARLQIIQDCMGRLHYIAEDIRRQQQEAE